ncbi:MAG: DUF6390 family protein [Patescibacteria group bacterium]
MPENNLANSDGVAHCPAPDGVGRCACYAFGPNKLHLCGPDANKEVFAYLKEGASDQGLENILQGFQTLYPYLRQIAQANKIKDPFDDRVVEAYWLGNQLLEQVTTKVFYKHLAEGLHLKDRYNSKSFDQLADKLPQGARMHHSFHVFNAYKRTGHDAKFHDLDSMDACRVSWGKVMKIDGPKIIVKRKPLLLEGHKLYLGNQADHTIMRKLEDDGTMDELKEGEYISLHWGVPCEVIGKENIKWLEYYTEKHIVLANQTL